MTIDDEESQLTDKLQSLVTHGPGSRGDPGALLEALGILAEVRSAALGDDVTGRSRELEDSFKEWFSDSRKWNDVTKIEFSRMCLHHLINGLQAAIQTWLQSRAKR
jgi:hypothetical protein